MGGTAGFAYYLYKVHATSERTEVNFGAVGINLLAGKDLSVKVSHMDAVVRGARKLEVHRARGGVGVQSNQELAFAQSDALVAGRADVVAGRGVGSANAHGRVAEVGAGGVKLDAVAGEGQGVLGATHFNGGS